MEIYDIVFIGSGLSSSVTLYNILSKIRKHSFFNNGINIAVIEKNNEFWKGVAYGNRASVHSLTINPVKDFFLEEEKPVFFQWLEKFRSGDQGAITAQEKEVLNNWILSCSDKLDHADVDGVYIPRFLYGIYLAQKLENIIAECKADNLANIDLICGEVINAVKQNKNQYTVEMISVGERLFISTNVLVLSTGGLDISHMNGNSSNRFLNIEDIYEPSLDATLNKLDAALKLLPPPIRNILITGSNASASEMVYLLNKRNKINQDSFNKIVILSSSGLPDRLDVNSDHDHILKHLKDLEEKENYFADALMDAIEKDVKNALENQLSAGKILYSLNERFFKIQKKLSDTEALKFFRTHGWSYTRITRRTSEDYYIAEAELVKTGKLHFLKGRFIKLCDEQNNNGGLIFTYKATDTVIEKEYEDAFPIVINCTGAEHIAKTSTTLIKNLLDTELLKINENGMGLAVDESLAANDNLYVIGPLLAGIYTTKYKFWHLENAKRLNGLASALSNIIFSKIVPQV